MTHELPQNLVKGLGPEERLEQAELVLLEYARAHCVVTSRLHCALPCVAFGTPVIFVMPQSEPERVTPYLDLFSLVLPRDQYVGGGWEHNWDWENPEKPHRPTLWIDRMIAGIVNWVARVSGDKAMLVTPTTHTCAE